MWDAHWGIFPVRLIGRRFSEPGSDAGVLGAATLALLALLTPLQVGAEQPAKHRSQTWLSSTLQGSLRGNLWLWTDLHVRMQQSFHPAAALVRPGLTWRALPTLFLTGGYAWTPSWSTQGPPFELTDEHRAWEQIMWTPSSERTGVSGIVRGRFEQRFRPADHDDVGLRVRLMTRIQVPILRRLPVFFVAWDELFLAINDARWGQRHGVDQNRLFVGAAWQLAPKVVRLELGYTNVRLVRPGSDTVAHVFAINTFIGWKPPV